VDGHRFRTEPLERIWASLRASTVGLRWGRLALRTAGLFLVMFALVQSVLTLAGTHDLDTAQWFGRR
jgi:hypothetical protein